jgi:hypothetical protein
MSLDVHITFVFLRTYPAFVDGFLDEFSENSALIGTMIVRIMIFTILSLFKFLGRRYFVISCQLDLTLLEQKIKNPIGLADIKAVLLVVIN